MSVAYLHIILNHLPIVGIPICLIYLAYGLVKDDGGATRLSLIMLLGLCLLTLPVYFSGESAEHLVEHFPGVLESRIERHEDAAQISLALSIVLALSSAIGLWLQKKDTSKWAWFGPSIVGLGILLTLSFTYTAKLGGEVRHVEFLSKETSSSHEEAAKSQNQDLPDQPDKD